MKEFFFDTETSSMLDFKLPAGHHKQPARILQFAGLLYVNGDLLEEFNYYTMPDVLDFVIDPEAQAIHKITMEKLLDEAKPMDHFRQDFLSIVRDVDIVIAHNYIFDAKMAAHELALAYQAVCPKENYCTMLKSTNICKIPNKGRAGNKWPKLTEAHYHFFGEDFENAHDALADVRACEKIYRKLQEMGVE